MKLWIIGAVVVLMAVACSTKENIIPNNTIPQDQTVGILVQENYINRVYISLLGRKPDSTEKRQTLNLFAQDQCAPASREAFIRQIMQKKGFYEHVFKILRREYLNDVDTASIRSDIRLFTDLAQREPRYQKEYLRMVYKLRQLEAIPTGLAADSFKIAEAHRRCVDNNIYDDINMGSENFVTSVFTNFLFRYPTLSEKESGVKMVDGQMAVLFGKYGSSKREFINLFFSRNDYFEGQVRLAFRRFLLRQPTSQELADYTQKYAVHQDYRRLYLDLLKSDAYLYQR
jgi:hypothetical protein